MSDERRALLRSLEGRPPDDALLARMEALFLDQGDTARARWVRLEREGYDQRTTHTNLRDVLGPDLAQEVLDAIVRTRTRRGALRVGDDGPVVHWPHFFVEPLPQLQEWRNRVVHKAGPIVAEFSIEPGSDEPHSLAFPGTVFIDVVNAITVELADALRRSAA